MSGGVLGSRPPRTSGSEWVSAAVAAEIVGVDRAAPTVAASKASWMSAGNRRDSATWAITSTNSVIHVSQFFTDPPRWSPTNGSGPRRCRSCSNAR